MFLSSHVRSFPCSTFLPSSGGCFCPLNVSCFAVALLPSASEFFERSCKGHSLTFVRLWNKVQLVLDVDPIKKPSPLAAVGIVAARADVRREEAAERESQMGREGGRVAWSFNELFDPIERGDVASCMWQKRKLFSSFCKYTPIPHFV
jgi:hypothetical protein